MNVKVLRRWCLAGALSVLAAARPAAAQVSYPSCSRCTESSTAGTACWSDATGVLSSCGEEGLCENKACAGPGETYAAAIARYIQNKRLLGCASSYTTAEGFPAKVCTASVVVFNPTRKCAYGMTRSTTNNLSQIGALWMGTAKVNGTLYDVGTELGAPASELRVLKHAAGGDSAGYQMFDRGGITMTPSWLPGFPSSAHASWVGGRSEHALVALGARWKQSPFILSGTQFHSASGGGYAVHGYHDARWPTTLYSDGGPARKIGGTTDVSAALWRRWSESGGFDGPDALSYPLGDEANGAQRFLNGNLAADGSSGSPNAYLLGEPQTREADALYDLWQATTSVPRTAAHDTMFLPEGGGGFQLDNDQTGPARGSFVIKSGSDRAYLVAGDKGSYWRRAEGAGGFLKWPTGDATEIAGGSVQEFEGGQVFQEAGGPAFAVEGGALSPILSTYLAVGGPGGVLGYPIEDAPNPGSENYAMARVQRFQHGSITATGPTVATPEIYPGIDPHTHFAIQLSGERAVKLTWKNSGSPYTFVYRQGEVGQPIRIATLSLPVGDASFIDDSTTAPPGPEVGAFNCYTITAAETTSCAIGNYCFHSQQLCLYLPAPGEVPVSRVQLRVKVGTVSGADLDSDVEIRLNGWNSSWIDTPRDDLEKGSNVLFDLQTDYIHIASDIREITVSVPGDDGLCIDELELFLNCGVNSGCGPATSVFKKVFGPTSCAWARNSEKPQSQNPQIVNVPYLELRAPNSFGTWPEPFTIRQGIMQIKSVVSIADAAVAQKFHGADHNPRFEEGTDTVAVVKDPATLNLTQTIQVDCGFWCGYGTTTAVANYDLVLVRTGNPPNVTATTLEVQHPSVGSETDSWLDYFGPFWSELYLPIIDTIVDGRILDQLKSFSGNALGAPPPGKFFCFSGSVLTICP